MNFVNIYNFNSSSRVSGVCFTHTDADGMGCGLVARFNATYDYSVVPMNIGKQDEIITNFINDEVQYYAENGDLRYHSIIITDIGVNDDTAARLDWFSKTYDVPVSNIDHHPTNKLCEKYSWAICKSEDESGRKISATRLVYDIMKYELNIPVTDKSFITGMENLIETIVNQISDYDTWEWVNNPNGPHPEVCEYYTIINRVYGVRGTIDVFIENISNGISFSSKEVSIIEYTLDKRAESLKNIDYKVDTDEDGNRYALMFMNPLYGNAMMHEVYSGNPDLEYVMAINPVSPYVALRSSENSKIDLGLLAKEKFHGGGHPHAAGGKVEPDAMIQYIMKMYGLTAVSSDDEMEKTVDPASIGMSYQDQVLSSETEREKE